MEVTRNLKTKCKTQEALVMLTYISQARISDIKKAGRKKPIHLYLENLIEVKSQNRTNNSRILVRKNKYTAKDIR